MNKQYVCIEDFPIEFDWWGNRYGKGTVKAGWIYTVVKEPTPEKKLYKMIRITKHGEDTLYVRKSHLKKYFKEWKESMTTVEDGAIIHSAEQKMSDRMRECRRWRNDA